MVSLAAVIGLLGGFGAIGIQLLIRFFQKLLWGKAGFPIAYIDSLPFYMKIAVPTVGGLLVGLMVYYLAREAKGHGVPEVMEAIALRNGVIRPRVAIVKLLASSLCIGSGGSVGREGPVIQIGSSIGSTIGQLLRINPERVKTFVACGASAGIAAAFNAPIAGALFSVEIILGDFAVAQFSPIVISSVVATVVSRRFLGNYPAFTVPTYELISPHELLFYALLGLLAGLVAVLYVKSLYATEEFFERLNIPGFTKTAVGGLALGLIGLFLPHIFGVGYNTMDSMLNNSLVGPFDGDLLWPFLIILMLVKIVATSISLGSGGSGGVFAPSLFIGTMAGGFFGELLGQFFPGQVADSAAYALVGMGALVAGSTHAPITAILIIFEMTNDYKIILPLMITCVIATLVSIRLQKESIYTLKLVRRGVALFRGRETNLLKRVPVKNVMRSDPVIISAGTSLPDLIALFVNSHYSQFFVCDAAGKFVGRVCLADVRRLMQEKEYLSDIVIAHDLMSESVPAVKPGDSLDQVMRLFGNYDVEELPVIDEQDADRIVGVVSYRDVIETYNRELVRRDLLNETSASIRLAESARKVAFLDGYAIAEIPVPARFNGRTLKELNLRGYYGVNILMIKRHDAHGTEKQIVPMPEEKILTGDRLIAVGKEKDLDRLKNG